jgi:hypothetical protein
MGGGAPSIGYRPSGAVFNPFYSPAPMGANAGKHLPALAHIGPRLRQPGAGALVRSTEPGRSLSLREVAQAELRNC